MFYEEDAIILCRSRHQERNEKFREVNRRHEQFKKNLRKQYRHLADEPSCRLGKNAKKNAARLKFILKTEDDKADEINEKTWNKVVPDYMTRVVSKRIKRKVGHRVINHEEKAIKE